jgi:hypothetical protein
MSDPSDSDPPPATPGRDPYSRQEQQRRARRMRALNVFMRPLLSLPFRTPVSRQLMLVEITGRKSGRIYKQPVSFVRDGDALLTPGGGNWKLNLREDRTNRLHLDGKWLEARPELVKDADTVTGLLSRMHAASPGTARFIPVLNRDGSVDRPTLERALAHGFLIVRWQPDGGLRP